MTVVVGTGGIKSAIVKNKYPVADGLEQGTTKNDDHVISLKPQIKSFLNFNDSI